jgi:uncharacterized protein YdeI (YjbR/CyaY-like superfamily)
MARTIRTLELRTRREWRSWLQRHHDAESEIWLVFPKRHTGERGISDDAAVEEALCFGWIDSLVRRLDDDRYARKFTPRKPESRWSTASRRHYAELEARGQLAPAGRARAPTERSGDAPRPASTQLPPYIEEALKSDTRAWQHFERLLPSQLRLYLAWIDSARRDETKARRLREAVRLLAAGRRLGLK